MTENKLTCEYCGAKQTDEVCGVEFFQCGTTNAEGRTTGTTWDQSPVCIELVGMRAIVANLPKAESGVCAFGDSVTETPCDRCGGECVEFVIPNDLWNAVIRKDGKERDDEYICHDCWHGAIAALARLVELNQIETPQEGCYLKLKEDS